MLNKISNMIWWVATTAWNSHNGDGNGARKRFIDEILIVAILVDLGNQVECPCNFAIVKIKNTISISNGFFFLINFVNVGFYCQA